MELPRLLWVFLGLVVAVTSAPVHYITLPASTYPLAQGNPFYYLSNPLSRTAFNPQESENHLKYAALSYPGASPDQRYVIAPHASYQDLLPFGRARVAALGPQGYVVYPAFTGSPAERQGGGGFGGILSGAVNFLQQQFQNFQLPSLGILRPGNRPGNQPNGEVGQEVPNGANAPLPQLPLSEGVSGPNPTPEETEDLDTVNTDENQASPASAASPPPAAPAASPESNAESVENPVAPAEVAEEKPESPLEETNAEVASESRILFARSRAYPGRDGEGEMEEEGEVGEQEEEEEDKEEEGEKEEDDSVVIGPGSANPSIAQAKPAAIALAGMGGVAAAAPRATAVVGANGLAVSAPTATAVAGPSAGSATPGLFPKGTKVKRVRVTPEEAKINAEKIQAARQSAFDAISGLRMEGLQSFPFFGYRF